MESPLDPDQHPIRTRPLRRAGESSDDVAGVRSMFSRDGLLVWHGGVGRLRIGWSAIVVALLMMLGAWWFSRRPGDADLPSLALLCIFMAAAGSTFQASVHLLICHFHKAIPPTLVLTASGFRVIPEGFFGAWLMERRDPVLAIRVLAKQRLREVAGPPLALCIAAAAAWGIDWLWAGGVGVQHSAMLTERASSLGVVFRSPAEIATWTWLLQAAWTVLPIPGCQGRAMLESCTFLVHDSTRRSSTSLSMLRHVDLIQSLLAICVVGVGIYLWQNEAHTFSIPSWPFVIALGILMWSGRKPAHRPRAAQSLERTAQTENAHRSSRGLGMLGRWRVRRAQRAEWAEAIDAKQLDEVLDKLHSQGPASLNGVEKRLLDRVSRRLRSKPRTRNSDV